MKPGILWKKKDGYMLSKQFIKSGDGWYYLKANGELHTDPAFKTEPDGLITVVDKEKKKSNNRKNFKIDYTNRRPRLAVFVHNNKAVTEITAYQL